MRKCGLETLLLQNLYRKCVGLQNGEEIRNGRGLEFQFGDEWRNWVADFSGHVPTLGIPAVAMNTLILTERLHVSFDGGLRSITMIVHGFARRISDSALTICATHA